MIKAPKGTDDILPGQSEIWQFMEDKARYIFEKSNYQEIRTPIFEATELFKEGWAILPTSLIKRCTRLSKKKEA